MMDRIKMKEIVLTFVNAVDIVNPILKHHHRRVAVMTYHIAKSLGYEGEALTNLIIAAALHDIGALTVEDQTQLTRLDVEDPGPHERLGALMLSSFGPFKTIANIIEHHHVNYAENIGNRNVHHASYIIHLADRIDILLDPNTISINQTMAVTKQILDLSGTLFDPDVVKAFVAASEKEQFWFEVDDLTIDHLFQRINLEKLDMDLDDDSLENLVYTLSRVVDYKSKFTIAHSVRVAYVADKIAKYMGLVDESRYKVKLAGYLHDYGKIAVPTEIITKKTKLTNEEFNIMKSHPYYTYQILSNIEGFSDLAHWASHHHEKLHCEGYPFKPEVSTLDLETEILIYSDLFSALLEERPYRKPLSTDRAIEIIENEFVSSIGSRPLQTLKNHAEEIRNEINRIQEDLIVKYDRAIVKKNNE
ncbi:HD domain-containing phosphohydrolase [Fusibacter sp. JL216-2]|uniref:HD domain-containing phosphohydrolase n=1 Tax=Fusibacter sp. JL216-2 TaxID=3071453 RepID=UPI003D358C61